MTNLAPEETLLMSSTRTVHRASCPSMRHVTGGRRKLLTMDWRSLTEEFSTPHLGAEHYRVKYVEYPTPKVVDLRVSAEELSRARTRYVRCMVCSPDVPEYAHQRRTVSKIVGLLGAGDLGRGSEGGVVVSVCHREGGTWVYFDGEPTPRRFDAEERIWFFIASGSTRRAHQSGYQSVPQSTESET